MKEDAFPHPIVTQQIELALAPYRALLPGEVLEGFGFVLTMVLDTHPVGISFVARLKPAVLVGAAMSHDADERNEEGYAVTLLWRAVVQEFGAVARRERLNKFLPPEASMNALIAFLSYLPYDEYIWETEDEEARRVIGLFCDAVVGVVFFSMVRELERRPAAVAEWGEIGRALAAALPGARAVLRRALSDVDRDKSMFLEEYPRSRWDIEEHARRMGVAPQVVINWSPEAMMQLGSALRWALDPDQPGRRRGPHRERRLRR